MSIGFSNSGAKSRGTGTAYENSLINAGGKFKTDSENLNIAGANIEANKVDIKAKNIVIESKQDKSERKDSSHGTSLTITANPAMPIKDFSINSSKGNGEGAWVDKQSSLIARNGGNIEAENKLTNTGAIIGSLNKDKKLKVEAKEIVINHLEDKNKYENKGGGISASIGSTPNVSVVHDKVDKEQVNRATAINTDFTISGEKKTSEELGFNTDLSKAQEKTKDEEKHLNAELHTDLIDKEKRDEIVSAGRKIIAVVDALTEDKGADKFDIYKAGLRAIHIDELRKDKEKEFAFIDDENTAPLDKLRALRELQSELYRREGYEGALPELYLTDEPNSFAVDGKNGGTRKIFISLNDLKRGNPSALLYGHENAHLVYYDKDEEIAKYAETKIGASKSKNKFTSKEQEEYLSNLRKNISIDKTLEEQFSLAKNIPSEDRENFTPFSYSTSASLGVAVNHSGTGVTYTEYIMKDIKNNRVEVVKVKESDIGLAGPYDVGGALSFGIYNLKSYDEFGNNVTATGASVDPLWAYNRLTTGNDEGLGLTTGGEIVTNQKKGIVGIKLYIGKSFKNYEFHSKTSIDDITEIVSREIYTIPEYLKKYHSRGGRNSWR